ncbi:hypothetical protein [Galenea microaerophila]
MKETLTAQEIRALLSIDVFYVIPKSLTLWLDEFNFSLGQRLLIERIISKAILKSIHKTQKALQVTFSFASLAREVGGCDKKTIASAIKKFKELGILNIIKETKNGTCYEIIVPEKEIKEKITYRRQTKTTSLQKQSTQETPDTPLQEQNQSAQTTHSSDTETKLEKLKNQLQVLRKIHQEKLDLYYKLTDQKPGQKIDIKRKMTEEEIKVCDDIADIHDKIESIERQMQTISTNKEKKETVSESIIEPKKNQPKQAKTARFIRAQDIKALKTRLDKLKINGNLLAPETRDRIFNEIVWAIRFGHLSQKEGSTFYLINHALKIVKDNVWRTPIGFEISQIINLTRWALNKKEAA